MKVEYNIHISLIQFTGTAQEFKRKFENPILRGRDADATENEHKRGQEKLQEVRYYYPCLWSFFCKIVTTTAAANHQNVDCFFLAG